MSFVRYKNSGSLSRLLVFVLAGVVVVVVVVVVDDDVDVVGAVAVAGFDIDSFLVAVLRLFQSVIILQLFARQ